MSPRNRIDINKLWIKAAQGLTMPEMVKFFGVSKTAIYRACSENNIHGPGLGQRGKVIRRAQSIIDPPKPERVFPGPPSRAMLALAQFDPVVAEAVALRLKGATRYEVD